MEERLGNAHLPEMIHGHNGLQCTHEATGTCLCFDALHGLRGWVVRASLHTCACVPARLRLGFSRTSFVDGAHGTRVLPERYVPLAKLATIS